MVIGNLQCLVCCLLWLTIGSLSFVCWNLLFLILSNMQVVASYFPLPQCIEGLKVMVESLFGATFHSIPLAPGESWHEDVLKLSLHHPEEVSTWMIRSLNSSRYLEKLLNNVGAISNVHNNIYVSWVCCTEYNKTDFMRIVEVSKNSQITSH